MFILELKRVDRLDEKMLEVKEVYCGYGNEDIVKNANLSLKERESLFIIGPNGSGKSTLLKAIAGLIPYRGTIQIDSKEINTFNRKELAQKVGLMSQISSIYFPYTIYETVSLGRYAYGRGSFFSETREDKEIILENLDKVGLYSIKDKLISELSGGQLQRVFLARTFTQNPDIILLDEPTNHLDLKYQIELLEHLKEWSVHYNKSMVGVLHDLNLVQQFAGQVALLNEGEIIAYGTPRQVLEEQRLQEVYGTNIKAFMLEVLEKWK